MIYKCVQCNQAFETENKEICPVCPVCVKSRNKVKAFFAILALLLLVALVVGVFMLESCTKTGPEEDVEQYAMIYAGAFLLSQVRDSHSAQLKYTNKYKSDGAWYFQGELSGENMMGGTSFHAFFIGVKHKESVPYWDVITFEISQPY